MTDNPTYKAELIGPTTLGNNEIIELPFIDGAYQDLVELSFEAGDTTSVRTWALGEGTVEPIPYNFVGEIDSAPPSVEN
ncbi:hypothetical protein KPL76_00510 [Subtercola sp. PAMC28395]|uniref:hypothetical protein n=1 Tax=Subtercola sp. PAMC28395 TaxID=2846775 RepID=UPI001C0ACADC|nr:hypothetical protein [Subtercola sp. PAMC28395]QWT23972.1 hypothetical protein KPL76_00510 [Subtercola sp. PAMC28395]